MIISDQQDPALRTRIVSYRSIRRIDKRGHIVSSIVWTLAPPIFNGLHLIGFRRVHEEKFSLGDYYEAIRLQIFVNRPLEQPHDLQAVMKMTGVCQAPQTPGISGQNREYDGAAIAYESKPPPADF